MHNAYSITHVHTHVQYISVSPFDLNSIPSADTYHQTDFHDVSVLKARAKMCYMMSENIYIAQYELLRN